ncbi:helix-turn-helix domain-containing protein [Cytobacillus sp. FJAT-53684]|uniref:Helix-turn-helix domain-containing protein n=1 Tax=Cytobacillus mangrovibacter TaxID=3299024 RepID=A0ABW6K6D6_9BACI
MSENKFGFGLIVKRSRTEQNLTLSELSEKTNGLITASYINRLENGQKTKPSFDVVAELSKALNLDMREVFLSFGYESLINVQEQEGYSIEDVFRLTNIKLPGVFNERLINREEQEALIRIINATFEYSFAEEANAIDKLTVVIKQIHSLRELEHKQFLLIKTIEIPSMDITYTIEFDHKIMQEFSDLKDWKEAVKIAVAKYENFIRDYQGGILSLPIGSQEWIVAKEGTTLKLLFKKSDLVSL